MNFSTRLMLSVSFAALFTSCVDNGYDIKKIEDVNTDISFGGPELAVPIGNLSPISLDRFIKETNLIKLVNGQYELQNSSDQVVKVPTIAAVSITPSIPAMNPVNVNFDPISLDDIDTPDVRINGGGKKTVTDNTSGDAILLEIPAQGTSKANIGYTFSDELKQINWVSFGDSPTSNGDLLTMTVTSDYNGTISNPVTKINDFNITFPYGFELGLPNPNPYGATLSNGNKTLTITNKTVTTPIEFYVKKVTFNPSIDQTVKGELNYSGDIVYNAQFDVTGTTTGNTGDVNVSFSAAKKLKISNGDFNTNNFNQSLNENSAVAIDETVPADIISLESATVDENCILNIKSEIKNLPSWVTTVNLSNYKISFPKFLVFKAGQGISSDNTIVLNKAISASAGLNENYIIEGFKFDTNPISNGRIIANDKVILSGGFIIPEANNVSGTQVNEIQNIVMQPSASISKMNLASVTGIVDPNIQIAPISIDVDLGSDMDFINNSTLDLSTASIQIAATNPTGVTAEIGLTITTFDNNNTQLTQVKQLTGILIQPNTKSMLWVSNSQVGMPEGYTYVECPTLPSIFLRMPSVIKVDLDPNTRAHSSTIELNNQSTDPMIFACDIIAPINVGPNFELTYSEKVTNLQADIADYIDYITSLVLNINADNDIPLDLAITGKAFDAAGQQLTGLTITSDGVIKAGTKEGAAINSDATITIKETQAGELKKLDQVELSFKGNANQTVAGAPLKPNQTLKVKLSAKVPGGINFNPNK